jgi:hypothetical protein
MNKRSELRIFYDRLRVLNRVLNTLKVGRARKDESLATRPTLTLECSRNFPATQ